MAGGLHPSVIDQNRAAFRVVKLLCVVEWGAPPAIFRVRIGPVLQQPLHNLRPSLRSSNVHGGTPIVIRTVQVHPTNMQLAHGAQVAVARGSGELRDVALHFASTIDAKVVLGAEAVRRDEGMHEKHVGELFAELDPTRRVAQCVQFGRPGAEAEKVGNDDQEAAGDTALGGKTACERKLARVVVHAAAEHEAQAVFDRVGCKDALARNGTHPARRQGSGDARHGPAVHFDGASLEVQFQRFLQVFAAFDVLGEHA